MVQTHYTVAAALSVTQFLAYLRLLCLDRSSTTQSVTYSALLLHELLQDDDYDSLPNLEEKKMLF